MPFAIYKSMETTQDKEAKPSASMHFVRSIPQMSGSPKVMSLATPKRRSEEILKPRLLERRGSSTNLTIELLPPPESPPHVITPTGECTVEEFLLSAGNVLSRAQLKKVVKDPEILHTEFWKVPMNKMKTVEISGSEVKNRYADILPNPRTRVILPPDHLSDDPLAGYINANYIRGYDGEDRKYIATQGPLKNTVEDFWRMIWTEKVTTIVMINMDEEITLCSVMDKNDYKVRIIDITNGTERRRVEHYWYVSWPDNDVPKTADALITLASEINSLPGPIVVHCSAGVGRTGCFIALAIGMTQLERKGCVDMLGILCQMRYDRGGMIQLPEQYQFVHEALCLFEQTLDSKSISIDMK